MEKSRNRSDSTSSRGGLGRGKKVGFASDVVLGDERNERQHVWDSETGESMRAAVCFRSQRCKKTQETCTA